MTTITRGYRIRVYPNGAQRRLLRQWLGASRWLWNTVLEIRSEAYHQCGLSLTANDFSRWLTQWKHTAGHEWLAEVPATCLTQSLRDQDTSFRNFFAGRSDYPRFKRKRLAGSLRFQGVGAVWAKGRLSLPKLGMLKLAESLPKVNRPDMVTLSCDAMGRFHMSSCSRETVSWLPITHRLVGVDLVLKHLATLSTGEKVPNPKPYHRRQRYLRQQQRCLGRRQRGSARREKQRLRVARAHARLKQQRQRPIHELTTRLVREFDVIFIEDLNVSGMCRGLNAREMHDAAFSEVSRQLAYKCNWYGKIVEKVDRWYPSSKTCSGCQYRLSRLRLNERRWKCPKCGVEHDRDVNAARNLLTEGLRQLAGRDDRDLRVDARSACPKDSILVQMLADEARSRQENYPSSGEVVRLAAQSSILVG